MISHRWPAFTIVALLAACGGNPPTAQPAPVARVGTGSGAVASIMFADDWRASYLLTREDSMLITLPTGVRELQRQSRTARFSVTFADRRASVRLDSLVLRPRVDGSDDLIGSTWTLRLDRSGAIDDVDPSKRSALADDISNEVRALFPAIPSDGARPGTTWGDTNSTNLRDGSFKVSDHRVRKSTSLDRTERNGTSVFPIRVREDFEQLGRADKDITMTAQGRRTGTYYVTADGRIDGATLQDSAEKLVSIPANRQNIPTLLFSRITVRTIAAPRERR